MLFSIKKIEEFADAFISGIRYALFTTLCQWQFAVEFLIAPKSL